MIVLQLQAEKSSANAAKGWRGRPVVSTLKGDCLLYTTGCRYAKCQGRGAAFALRIRGRNDSPATRGMNSGG